MPIFAVDYRQLKKVEPPSHISQDFSSAAESLSEDPLSGYIFMVVDTPSEEEGYLVCAYSARTGLSYIGRAGGPVS